MVYTINRTATTALKDCTPIEAFERAFKSDTTNCKPQIGYLRVLGCKAYVYIQKERRVRSEKLEPRAEEGILVGYEGNSIYRVWIPGRKGGIVRTSTVVFDELVSD